jgi:flagellar hook-associated protein 2
MATLSSAGVGSGLDVNSLVSSLMKVEQRPLTLLTQKEATLQAKLTAFGTLKGALSALQTAANTLTSATTYTGKSAAVGDATVLSASATSSANAASYNINVTQLAKNHVVRSNASYDAADTFNAGSLAITVGGVTSNLDISSGSNNTLAGIASTINQAKIGVTAAVINTGSTNRLVLTSSTTGSAGAISVAVNETGSGATHSLNDFVYSGSDTAAMVQAQAADNALLSINNVDISRSNNTITDAIDGVTLNLSKTGSSTLNVTANTGTTVAAVNTFVKAYNDAVTGLRSASAYNAATKTASSLTGDSTVRNLQSQLDGLASTKVADIHGGITNLSDIGITRQKDGTLKVDSGKLQTALTDPNKDVAALFNQTTSGNEGIAVRFNTVLTAMVGSSGPIAARTEGINESIKSLNKQREAISTRLVSVEARYRKQFQSLDTLISSMNTTTSYLTQQLNSIAAITNGINGGK